MRKPPSYRLHKPSGRAVVQFKPLFGSTEHYLPGQYGSPESLAAYSQFVEAYNAYTNNRPAPVELPKRRRAIKVGELFNAFVVYADSHYGPKDSERKHYNSIGELLIAGNASTHAKDFGPIALKELRERMVRRKWARSYVNHQVARVRRIFKWGVANEMVDASVLHGLQSVEGLRVGKTDAPESARVQPVTWENVEALFPFTCPQIVTMIRFQWLTGCRPGEVCDIRGEHVERLEDVWLYRPEKHKTAWRGRPKVICLGPAAIAAVASYAREKGYFFRPVVSMQEHNEERRKRRTTPFYGSATPADRTPRKLRPKYTSRSYWHALENAFARADKAGVKIPHWHPHQIRHSRATAVRAQYGIEGAQALLGNTYAATTIYAEKSLELAIRIARETG